MALPFEFVADGVALFLRAEGSNRWRDRVKNFAMQRWPGQPPVADEVMVTVTCFHDHRQFDLDNNSETDSGCHEKIDLCRRRPDH